MTQQDHGDLLDQLLDPKDDRAWKIAAGFVLTKTLEQATKTNGRVTRLEKFMWGASGGLAVISAVVVPQFLELVK